MIDFTLSDEQAQLRDMARSFAAREIAPLARTLDAEPHSPAAADAFRGVHRRAAGAGLHALMIGEEHGGAGGTCVDNVLVQEELGAADVGLAGAINLTACIPLMLAAGGTAEQRAAWLPEIVAADDHILAGALNEPDTAGSELFCPLPDPALGCKTRARRDGDGYVLTGTKAAFVTNAAVAKAFMVFARSQPDKPPLEGTSVFYIPAETPGLSVGAPTALLGMRSSWHAEVILDDVRVPEDRRVGPDGGALALMGPAAAPMALGLAAGFVGVARAARDAAVAYAKERHSWGKPLAAHQAVGLHLAECDIEVRSARLVVWDAAASVDRGDPEAERKVPAAKAVAVDTAIRCAERAVKVHGGYGVSPEFGVEKLLRDAWTGWPCDFTGDMLRLQIAAGL